MTKVQLPGIVRRTFWVKKIIETVLPEPWVCQKTPSFAGGARLLGACGLRLAVGAAACRTSCSRASALFTPRY